MRVLAAFMTPQLVRIDEKASQIKGRQGITMQQSAAGARVSDSTDSAEIEASRLADYVASGGSVTTHQVASPRVYRQEEALAALTGFELAGGAESRLASGHPVAGCWAGWCYWRLLDPQF
jgi:hypothetical protein